MDENYNLDEKFQQKFENTESAGSDAEEVEAAHENVAKKRKFDQVNSAGTKSSDSANKKNKKKNITEILKLKKDELSRPTYAINEFKKHLVKYINVNLSSVEKNDLNLSEVSLTGEAVETLDEKLEKIILKRNKICNLPFNEQFNEKFNDKIGLFLEQPAVKRSPFLIILCSSAIRCIEVQKSLDASNQYIKSKKLRWMHAFAKHKKLKEQIDFLATNKAPVNLVYATPQRLAQLVEANALELDLLRYVVIDYSFRDVKQKRFIDMADIRDEFIKFCFSTLLKLNKEKTRVKFYLA